MLETNTRISTDEEPESSTPTPTPKTLNESHNDDIKAKYLLWIRYGILFILCTIYFIYQCILFSDSSYNRQTLTSIDTVETVDTPYFYAELPIDKGDMSNSFIKPITSVYWDCNYISINCNEIMYTQDFIYNSSVTNWTILRLSESKDTIFILPPYGDKMNANDNISFRLFGFDNTVKNDMTRLKYIEQLKSAHVIYFDVNNINFRDVNFGTYWNILSDNDNGNYVCEGCNINQYISDKAQLTTQTNIEFDILETNVFGKITANYNMNFGVSFPVEYNVYYDGGKNAWRVQTDFFIGVNSLHTKTNIIVDKKMTFFDVLAKTGGIYATFAGVTFVIYGLLVSGIKIGKYKIEGLAPSTSWNENEKRKADMYLREIGMV